MNGITHYIESQTAKYAAICELLRTEIDAVLTKVTSKIWHAMPVWFVGECPVVGYKASAKGVTLLFWNGQSFDEPGLVSAGKFKAAQIVFVDEADVEAKSLRRWLKKAGTDLWDYKSALGPRAKRHRSAVR